MVCEQLQPWNQPIYPWTITYWGFFNLNTIYTIIHIGLKYKNSEVYEYLYNMIPIFSLYTSVVKHLGK